MELNEYQKRAMTTCTDSSPRKGYDSIDENNIISVVPTSQEDIAELRKEAGDILWQLSGLCSVMSWSLEDVAQENLDKLADRQKRNVIVGEGDNR